MDREGWRRGRSAGRQGRKEVRRQAARGLRLKARQTRDNGEANGFGRVLVKR